MAGIYIHIPFCRQACYYCDFHFSTNPSLKSELVKGLIHEMQLRKNYLEGKEVMTIYLGGGTPSLLNDTELKNIFNAVYQTFPVSPNAEITLEANPDDLTEEKIRTLKPLPVNRLSIGVQSFFDNDLKWMNRVHDSKTARQSIAMAQDAGFNNISIDLIYGLPESSFSAWEENVSIALTSGIRHLSCYALTVEPKTALASFIKKGISKNINEDAAAEQFEWLLKATKDLGWEHYEISNFSLPGCYSRHNTSYWFGEKYIGIGPSAHSFDGETRQWNVANNHQYIQAIAEGIIPCEKETLDASQKLNETIMTRLRTMWGLDLKKINAEFGNEIGDDLGEKLLLWEKKGYLLNKSDNVVLNDKGKLIADRIILDLMVDDMITKKEERGLL